MRLDRRGFLLVAAGGLAAGALPSSPRAQGAPAAPVKAIAFDAFPIFDPRPLIGLLETLFPGKGTELGNAWRTRQFEYQWLRTLTGTYADFLQTTRDGLVFAARLLHLDLTPEKRDRLMQASVEWNAWPDVPAALRALKDGGLRLGFLSNMTAPMLEAGIARAGLTGLFDHVLSTDRVRAFKPDPRAYQMGVDAFGCRREEIVFAAFAGWDAAGARAFGYPTFWVNRLDLPAEELGVTPDAMGRDMADLVRFVNARR